MILESVWVHSWCFGFTHLTGLKVFRHSQGIQTHSTHWPLKITYALIPQCWFEIKHLCRIYILSCWNTHFIDEECWIYTWACNWNDIRIAENQATRWWTTTSYKRETKSWPNKNKKIFGCCKFCARLRL